MSNFGILDGVLVSYRGSDDVVVIPEGVHTIGERAFANSHIKGTVFPSSLRRMLRWAFSGCTELRQIVLPSTLEFIGYEVFSGCTKLEEVIVSEGIKELGQRMFVDCRSLKRVILPLSIENISGNFSNSASADIDSNYAFVPKASDVLVMEKAAERMVTKDQLSTSLKVIMPDDAESLAYVLAYQKHANWMKAVEEKSSPDNADAVLSKAVELLSSENKIDAKKASQLVAYALNHIGDIGKESLVKLRALLKDGGKSLSKSLKMLEADSRAAKFLEGDAATTEKPTSGSSPFRDFESEVIGRITWDQIALRVQKAIKAGTRYVDSDTVCHPSVLVYIISEYARQAPERGTIGRSKRERIDYCVDYWDGARVLPDVDLIAGRLDRSELCAMLEKMLDRATPVDDAAAAFGRYADDAHVPHLVDMLKAWAKSYRSADEKNAFIARGTLMLNESKAAMRYFESIKRLDAYASKHGRSADELRSMMDDFGLDENDEKLYDLGGRSAIAFLGTDLSWHLRDCESGKELKSIPKRGSDPEKYESAKTAFALLKKETKKLVKARTAILFDDFLAGKGFPSESWQQSYLTSAVMRALAETIVWTQDGKTFTVRGGRPIGCSGDAYDLGQSAVKVAHPVEMPAADVDAWRDYFARNGLKQPFEQIWERVAVKTKKSVGGDRYKGYLIPAYRFKGREKHGFHIDMGEYNDYGISVWIDGVDIEVKQHDFEWKSLDNRLEIVDFKPAARVTMRRLNHIVVYLDRVCFYPRLVAGDMTVLDELGSATLAQVIDYINVASDNGATELAAALLDYRSKHFGEYSGVESLLLD